MVKERGRCCVEDLVVRERAPQDENWIAKLVVERWGGTSIFAHGKVFDLVTFRRSLLIPNRD